MLSGVRDGNGDDDQDDVNGVEEVVDDQELVSAGEDKTSLQSGLKQLLLVSSSSGERTDRTEDQLIPVVSLVQPNQPELASLSVLCSVSAGSAGSTAATAAAIGQELLSVGRLGFARNAEWKSLSGGAGSLVIVSFSVSIFLSMLQISTDLHKLVSTLCNLLRDKLSIRSACLL